MSSEADILLPLKKWSIDRVFVKTHALQFDGVCFFRQHFTVGM